MIIGFIISTTLMLSLQSLHFIIKIYHNHNRFSTYYHNRQAHYYRYDNNNINYLSWLPLQPYTIYSATTISNIPIITIAINTTTATRSASLPPRNNPSTYHWWIKRWVPQAGPSTALGTPWRCRSTCRPRRKCSWRWRWRGRCRRSAEAPTLRTLRWVVIRLQRGAGMPYIW